MDMQQLEWGFSLSFSMLFLAGFAAWGISFTMRFFKMIAGG